MKIKSKLKLEVERFISTYYLSSEEMGGYLISNQKGIVAYFLPLPNQSEKPRTNFLFPQGGLKLAEQFARSRKGRVIADFHSHPDPCIMSAADQCYAQSNPELFFVTITPTGKWSDWRRKEYIWYVCKGIKPEKVEEV